MAHHQPLSKAIWKAQELAAQHEDATLTPTLAEEIAKAAVATYLDALANENKIRTGFTAGHDGGDSWIHRPVYSPDLTRLAEQARTAEPIGPAPEDELLFYAPATY